MCGIVGGINLPEKALRKMLSNLSHRGPDGRSDYYSGNFAMGMSRLAIVDQLGGVQPFFSKDGVIQAIFNGEIYNWRTLRKELEEKGYRFQTNCDGEILPAAWQEWQSEMFNKLNGMFSIAIYNAQTCELILARDHCGQKPLYYTRSGDLFAFSSEIKALKEAGIALSPNHAQLAPYLINRYVSEPASLFNEVEVLPAAHWMKVTQTGELSMQKYWTPHTTSESLPLAETLDRLDQVTRASVSQTLQNDWKSVLYLSSGVDSSLLAQYMSELGAGVSSLAIGFQTHQDETFAAESFAKSLGIEHHNIHLGCEALEELPRVISQMERPVGDALIIAFDALAKGAKSLGAKVAYGAEGIDEHFGGYSFHQAYLKAHKLGKAGRWGASQFLKTAPDALINRLTNFPASLGEEGKQRVIKYLRDFDSLSKDGQADYLRFLYEPSELTDVISSGAPPHFSEEYTMSEQWSVNQLLARQYDSWLQDWALIRQDKNSMAHSLEYRCPFLNPELIKLAFSLPAHWKIRNKHDKWIWRKLAERKLSRENARRPKMPFYLPLEQELWRKKLVEMSHDILTPQALSQHGWISSSEVEKLKQEKSFLPLKKLAALLIFQLWYDQYF